MDGNLANFIKYCHGYVNLTKKRILSEQNKNALELPRNYLDLGQILLCNIDKEKDNEKGVPINFDTFYTYDPQDVPENEQLRHATEKELAKTIEDLCSAYIQNPYTKQIYLQFGRFVTDHPIENNEETDEGNESCNAKKKRINAYKLFSLPIKIEKVIDGAAGKYFVYPADTEIQINTGIFETVLGENLYHELLSEIGKREAEAKFTLPLCEFETVCSDVIGVVKAQLRLCNIAFNEESFELENISLVLSPRVNYFLVEDLVQLTKLPEIELGATALSVWMQNDGLDVRENLPNENQLYFPFPFDKSQLDILSLMGNKASIVQGPPGTGKSTTIANILCHLAANGKRILFVSQKAQALKVVKDKLKSTDIKYLFGYIPNASSAQVGDDDKNDGVALLLSSLGGYVEKLINKNNLRDKIFRCNAVNGRGLETVVADRVKERKSLNDSIMSQRRYSALVEEYDKLIEFNIKLEDKGKFAQYASEDLFLAIADLDQKIERLKDVLEEYEKNYSAEREQFDREFCHVPLGQSSYSEVLHLSIERFKDIFQKIEKTKAEMLVMKQKIDLGLADDKIAFKELFHHIDFGVASHWTALKSLRSDLEKTAYEGHNSILRSLSNTKRRWRLGNVFKVLPRELCDFLNNKFSQDISKNGMLGFVDSLLKTCEYFDLLKQLEMKKQEVLDLFAVERDLLNKKLPCEVMAWIVPTINKLDVNFKELAALLNSIACYFNYKETESEQLSVQNKSCELLATCGISRETFFVLEQKRNAAVSFSELKTKILRVQCLKVEIDEIRAQINESSARADAASLEIEHKKCITMYIQNIIDERLTRNWNGNILLKQAVRELGSAFGKSRQAFKTFDKIRKSPKKFKEILNLIPVWIMELDDASRIIPLEANLFDYVILDEASQCNIAYTMPVMYRTNKMLFVGDSEQMRDSTISFKSNRDFDELANRFQIPEENQIKATGTSVQSVLDIAYKRGFADKTLRYHYRSSPELIGFCNNYFYKPKGKELVVANSTHLTYKDTNRTMLIHKIESDGQHEKDDQINVAEADYILGLFHELRANEKYKNKSIGILTFFTKQALYLSDRFVKAGLKEEVDNYKVSAIEGIQGDEKDIIIYSFVIRNPDQKNKYAPLTGEDGDIRGEVNSGRVNVAFSRAREQVHCCISLPIDQMPHKIWIKKYLDYVEQYGVVKHIVEDLKPFDSYFEQTVFDFLHNYLDENYCIQNQVESCGFKIDFVVGNNQTGRRIALECDGPCHFENELDEACGIYVENDVERQRILESAGWQFYRIRYSDWLDEKFERCTVLNEIRAMLD
ncbi:TPA: hypothetical protein DDZ86_04325 [Candidatus Dependentiae bacterium]|nr:MAG: hypothetical protein UW09_C0003G0216 [candidate division TM6 bacterium GW2011_GWF2_43_87]HBL98841.1 hypothetical protein [Candidatus Dependentiae bacterium]